MRLHFAARTASVAAVLALTACGGGGSGPPGPGPRSTATPSQGTPSPAGAQVQGLVVDGTTLAPLGGAHVTAGAADAVTGAAGTFALSDVALDVEPLTVAGPPGYCTYTSGITVSAPVTRVAPVSLTPLSANESGWLAAMNADRAANGAGPLACDETALEVARAHAADMAANDYFSHWDLLGRTPYERYAAAGGVGYENENIAAGQPSYAAAEAAFLGDPVHRAQLLDPAHNAAGVGLASSGGYPYYDQELLTLGAVYDPAAVPPAAPGGTVTLRFRALRVPVGTVATGVLPLPTPVAPASAPAGTYGYPSPLAFQPATMGTGGLSVVTLRIQSAGATVVLGYGTSYETGLTLYAR